MKPKFLQALFLLSSIVILGGCFKKEEFKRFKFDDYEGTWGAPLIDSKLTLDDIITSIDNESIVKEGDNSYTFYFKDTIEYGANDLLPLPEQGFGQKVDAPFIGPLPGTTFTSPEMKDSFKLEIGNGAEIRSILLKQGLLRLQVNNGYRNVGVRINLTLNSLLKNNTPYNWTQALPFGINTKEEPLAGYVIRPGSNNHFIFTLSYTLTSNNGSSLSVSDTLGLHFRLKDLLFSLITGKLGTLKAQKVSGEVGIDIFNKVISGDVSLDSTRLNATVVNYSVGLPISFTIDNLTAFAYQNRDSKEITLDPSLRMIAVPKPNAVGDSSKKIITINYNNSNIGEAIAIAPNKINYLVSPSIISDNYDDYLSDKSKVKAILEIAIPFKGRVTKYVMRDTIEIKGGLDKREIIDSAVFKLKVENYLPLNVKGRADLLDSTYQIIGSIDFNPDDNFIMAGIFNAQGVVIAPTIKESRLSKSGKEYDELREKLRYIIIHAEANTPKDGTIQPVVTFSADNYLIVKISVLAKAKIKID